MFSADLGLSAAQRDQLSGMVTRREVRKGEILQDENTRADRAFYVIKGCLRGYTLDAKGKEHVFIFAPEGWVISDWFAYSNQLANRLYVDAIEDSEVEYFDSQGLESMFTEAGMSEVGLTRLVRRIAVLQKRIILLLSATARERYEDFLETYPDLVLRVPQRMIASYLGITPEALSKIKGEMAREGR